MDTSIEAITGTIEYRPLNALTTWPRNYRDGDVGAIITSILKFGFNGALRVWRDNVVMAGNHTLLALQSMQAQQLDVPRGVRVEDGDWLIPCVDISHLNETQAQAFAIADNRTTELAQNDPESLANLLQELALEDTALLEATGYDGDDLDALLVELGQGVEPVADAGAQVDRASELQEKWGTERGQVWQVGRHRIMCGDSTDADDVARLMDGNEPRLMVTDPPYGVEYDANWRNEAAEKGLIAHAASRVGKVSNDHTVDWQTAYMLATADVAYVWHADRHAKQVQNGLEACGFELRAQIIWAKSRFAISRGHYHWQHEPCLYAVRKGSNAGWRGDHSQTTLWQIELDSNVDGGHSTQKPVECMARPIRNHEGDVYDPFLGSGTTLVACEQTGRVGYGMEIDAAYVAVALERLAGMGLTVELLSDASE